MNLSSQDTFFLMNYICIHIGKNWTCGFVGDSVNTVRKFKDCDRRVTLSDRLYFKTIIYTCTYTVFRFIDSPITSRRNWAFRLDTFKRPKKCMNRMWTNFLAHRVSLWFLKNSTLLKKVYASILGFVQNTTQPIKLWRNCRDQLESIVLSITTRLLDTSGFWIWSCPKHQENWKKCERIVGLAKEAKIYSIIITPRDTLCSYSLYRPQGHGNWNNVNKESGLLRKHTLDYDQHF